MDFLKFWIVGVMIIGVWGFGDENLTYCMEDSFSIPYGETSQLSFSITASPSEYISSGEVKIKQDIQQVDSIQITYFNLLVFNISQNQGRQCYLAHFKNQTNPQLESVPCVQVQIIDPNLPSLVNNGCVNLTGCYELQISYEISLNQLRSNQALVFIDNSHANNTSHSFLQLQTKVTLTSLLSNGWFYWTVGLTCLLVINLIVITGVVLYWTIKYKKTQRRYQEFKITQSTESEQMKEQ